MALAAYLTGSILIGFILLRVYFRVADKYNIIDKPNERSSHKSITIRGAGIIFPAIALLYFFYSQFQYPFFIAGMMIIGILGFVDDIKNLNAKSRTVIQLVAVSLMFYEAGVYGLTIWIVLALYVFITGLINAYNFMDGLNGITGLYTLSILVPVLIFSGYQAENALSENLLISMIGASVIFLFFNLRKKAKCFLGDVGSVSIALLIAFVIITLSLQFEAWYFFALMSLYGVDSILTIAHRLLRKEKIFDAHRFHLYQVLANEEKWSHVSVALMYASIQIIANFILLFAPEELRWPFSLLSIVAFSLLYLTLKSKLVKKHGI